MYQNNVVHLKFTQVIVKYISIKKEIGTFLKQREAISQPIWPLEFWRHYLL